LFGTFLILTSDFSPRSLENGLFDNEVNSSIFGVLFSLVVLMFYP
jgi:hypothetical protein